MSLCNYFIMEGVSIVFLAGCLMHLRENDIFSTDAIRKFRRLIYVIVAEIIIDGVFALSNGNMGISEAALYLMKAIELAVNPILLLLVFDIFYEPKVTREDKTAQDVTMGHLRTLIIMITIANAVMLVASTWGKFVFYIDEKHLYQRGDFIFVYLLILAGITAILIHGIIIFSNKIQGAMNITLVSFTVILVMGVILRAAMPETNYDWLCVSVSIFFLLVYYSNVVLRVDPLTNLLNRLVYTNLIQKIDYPTVVIMIDANNFKEINDTYGHDCGDQTLIQLARVIRDTFEKNAYCFRLGGDEFCVILKPNVYEMLIEKTPHRDAFLMARKLMEQLDEKIKALNEDENSYLTHGVSQGYGVYHPRPVSSNLKDVPIGKVIEFADRKMYQNKERTREEQPTQES